MAEEVLRLRATVVSEEALTNLRALQREIGAMPARARPAMQQSQSLFAQMSKAMQDTTRVAKDLAPALGSIGVGAGSAALGAYALFNTVTRVTEELVKLKYASQELGLSADQIRGWTRAGREAAIAPEEMTQALTTFKHNMEDFQHHIGQVREDLIARGFGPVVEQMSQAKTTTDQLRIAMEAVGEVAKRDPAAARRLWEELAGTSKFARLSWEEVQKAIAETKPLPPGAIEDAQKYQIALASLGEEWDLLQVKGLQPLFPFLTTTLKEVNAIIDALEKVMDFADRLEHTDWNKVRANPPSGATTAIPSGPLPAWHLPPELGGPGGKPLQAPGGATTAIPQFQTGSDRIMRTGLALVHEGESITPAEGAGRSAGGAAAMVEFQTAIKRGTFEALVDFKSYLEAGQTGAPGGRPGIMQASFGGGSTTPLGTEGETTPAGGGGYGGGGVTPGGATTGGGGSTATPSGGGYGGAPSSATPSAGGGGGTGGGYGGDIPAQAKGAGFKAVAPRLMADLQRDYGMSKEDAAAIVGNLAHESGGFTQMQELNPRGGGRGGLGYAQWTGPRRREFEALLHGRSPADYDANYEMLKKDLSGKYAGVLAATRQAGSLEEKTSIFEKGFEGAGVVAMGSRISRAKGALTLPTDRVDESIAANGKGSVKAEGSVHISVNSNGTAAKVGTKTDGDLFTKTKVQSYRQMQPTSQPVGTVGA